MIYLDTSAIIRAWRSKKAPYGVTRRHSVAEFYSTITGRGLMVEGGRVKVSPKTALSAIRTVFANMRFHENPPDELFPLIEEAVSGNVQGPAIHDFFHAAAAVSAKVNRIATMNLKHFAALPQKLELVPVETALAESEHPPAK